MKKIISLVIVTCVLLAVIIGIVILPLNTEPNLYPQSTPLRSSANLENHINMSITESNDNQIIVAITNETIYSLETGIAVTIEQYNRGTWHVVPSDYPVIALALVINPIETMYFSAVTKNLPSGRYRIRQRVSRASFTHDVHDLTAEFYVD